MTISEQINAAAAALQAQVATTPHIALILGSGLSSVANAINANLSVDFKDIPHFRQPGASGHKGRLVFGTLGGQQVVCMQGRLHGYEGHTPQQVVFPLQVMAALGARTLLVTNAAGGINPSFCVGDIMLISDHINFTGTSPLVLSAAQGLTTFPDMTHAYTPALRTQALQAAATCGITLKQGVYLGLRGPNFETPAEIRAFATWGADAVGMSTVFEVLTAASLGMQVLGLSLITNKAAGMQNAPLTGQEVLQTSQSAAKRIQALLLELLLNWEKY